MFSHLMKISFIVLLAVSIPAFAEKPESDEKPNPDKKPPKQFVIGISSGPVKDSLRAHLTDLPKDQGLIVHRVIDEGSATEVLKVHDILLSADKVPLKEVDDLFQLVQKAGAANKSIELEILRAGNKQTVSVPAPKETDRPQFDHRKGPPWMSSRHGRKKYGPDHSKHDDHRMSPVPGHLMKSPFFRRSLKSYFKTKEGYLVIVEQLPDDEISVHVVSRDGERWKATGDKLDSLPESIQSEVREHLKELPKQTDRFPDKFNRHAPPQGDGTKRIQDLEKQIELMNSQLKALTKTIEALNTKLIQDKTKTE